MLSLPDSLGPRVEELVGDVQTHGPLPLPRVVPHPAVGEVVLPGRRGRGRGRGRRGAARGEQVARALAVLDPPADVLLLLLSQHHGGAVVDDLQHGERLGADIITLLDALSGCLLCIVMMVTLSILFALTPRIKNQSFPITILCA